MAARTVIIVQSYKTGAKGALTPAEAVACRSKDEARRRAEKVMATGRVVGADIVRQLVDEAAGDYGEPEYVARFGRVPEMAE